VITRGHSLSWLELFEDAVLSQADLLGELDARNDDGDFAENVRQGLAFTREYLALLPADGPRAPFLALGRGFLEVGSMGGALLGMVFHAISRGCREDDDLTLSQLAVAVRTASATVARRTGATLGQKTLLDALLPADWALGSAVCAGADAATALDQAAAAAESGARVTGAMPNVYGASARRGVAYDGGASDPGAVTVALFFAAGAHALGRRQGAPV